MMEISDSNMETGANDRFNAELEKFLRGKLPKGHIFRLGIPGELLRKTGFPPDQEIELSATRLEEKSKLDRHPFDPGGLKNLVAAINEPVAVFAYGDKAKAQNIIVEIQKGDKNFLVGIHLNQERRGIMVSDIRSLFPKDNPEWLNWINQGKLLYADTKKLQAVITQQRMNSAEVDYLDLEPIERLLQKNRDVKGFFPGIAKNRQNPVSHEAGKDSLEEDGMSDITEHEDAERADDAGLETGARATPEEAAFRNALEQRAAVMGALRNGTLACLPGEDGYADTGPAVNIANGTRYHGANLLQLKTHQLQGGFPTAEYATAEQIERSGVPIRKGERGVSISFGAKNEETGGWEQKSVRLFNVAQTVRPWDFRKWAEERTEAREQERADFLRAQYGSGYRPPEKQAQAPGPDIVCSSTDPEKYLGQYLAAVSMGGRFKVSQEQAAEFSAKLGDSVWERKWASEGQKETASKLFAEGKKAHFDESGITDPFKLRKICTEASSYCKDLVKDLGAELRAARREETQEKKIEDPGRKPEQKQSRGRSR